MIASAHRRAVLLLTTVIALALQLSCGGGVESGGTGGGASFASGPVTGFGSVIVNGVRYDDATARVEDADGNAVSRTLLQLGMTTEIDASAVTPGASGPVATAMTIRFASDVVGPVSAVNVAGAGFTALGQRVRITPTTVFDAAFAGGLAALRVGAVVEVYGQFDVATQTLVATRVQPAGGATTYRLRGRVSALDTAARTVTVGGLVVSYAASPPADPASAFAIGNVVRLKLLPLPSGAVWTLAGAGPGAVRLADGRSAEVDGRISAFSSLARFSVDGVAVDASAAAFPNGSNGVVLGARVEVEGLASGGVLVATAVKFEADDRGGNEPFELHGTISAADAINRSFVVRGITVNYTNATRFDSSTAAGIADGRAVDVHGTLSTDGTMLVATSIHVEM